MWIFSHEGIEETSQQTYYHTQPKVTYYGTRLVVFYSKLHLVSSRSLESLELIKRIDGFAMLKKKFQVFYLG
jgi:hypothetical protein